MLNRSERLPRATNRNATKGDRKISRVIFKGEGSDLVINYEEKGKYRSYEQPCKVMETNRGDRAMSGRATSSYESSKTIWIERGERESHSCDLIHYTRVRTQERKGGREGGREGERRVGGGERLHTFPHGNRQAIVVIKETDEGTKRRNKRVGWSRPAVYGALHLLAPYNPPRASKRASERARPVWSHLTSDFAFDSLLANGSRISIRLPRPCLSYMICCDERNLLLCNFSSPATSIPRRPGRAGHGRRPRDISGIEIEIGIEVGWRGSPRVRACRVRASHVPSRVARSVQISGRTSTRALRLRFERHYVITRSRADCF
ncbi:hypothetical protein ALC62_00422 [Cyphomyrmex costatus]|uniref:Uncharacterized protein n=1 Tax=Cyphomyrmex costatus TaxID=456900 RepID=A0A151IQR4_9HYME|nr:hypothetical protein ALC62_00422 [Cyphomyrmex costatus]